MQHWSTTKDFWPSATPEVGGWKVQSWGLHCPRARGVQLTSNHVPSCSPGLCSGMGFFVQGKYHCTWRKSASVLRGYLEFIQISFGIFCETSLLLAFLVAKNKQINKNIGLCKGGDTGRWTQIAENLLWNEVTTQSLLKRGKYERNVKRHHSFLFPEAINHALIKSLIFINLI